MRAKDTSVLEPSHIVAELRAGCRDMEMFPVLIDGQIGYFHDVDGGFASGGQGSQQHYHVVNLIHRVQGHDSPPKKLYDDTIEAHLEEYFYQMDVADIAQLTQTPSGLTANEQYPQGDFVLSLKVTDYRMGPYSFSEAMSADIDKREEEHSHNNV